MELCKATFNQQMHHFPKKVKSVMIYELLLDETRNELSG